MQLKNTFQAIFYTIILISVTATLFSNLMNFYSLEIDETTYVTEFVDGDSFKVVGDEVRLADVSAPEYYEEGGTEASEALRHLLEGETLYLDTDQKGGRDPYGRLVAVVYIKVDSTRYENINKALLIEGVVVETDYTDNEFNPSNWTLYSSVPNLQDVIQYLLISSGAGLIIILILHLSSRKLTGLLMKPRGASADNLTCPERLI